MSAMKKWFPSKWLAADDITENQIVTVKAVQDERVGTDQEEKGVIYFDAFEKGVILNRTNADALAAAFGEDVITEPFSFAGLRRTFRACQLYDYEQHRWLDFDGHPTSNPGLQ